MGKNLPVLKAPLNNLLSQPLPQKGWVLPINSAFQKNSPFGKEHRIFQWANLKRTPREIIRKLLFYKRGSHPGPSLKK